MIINVVCILKVCNWIIFNKIVFLFKCFNYLLVGRWINVYKYWEVNGWYICIIIIFIMGYFYLIMMVKDIILLVLKFV